MNSWTIQVHSLSAEVGAQSLPALTSRLLQLHWLFLTVDMLKISFDSGLLVGKLSVCVTMAHQSGQELVFLRVGVVLGLWFNRLRL